MKKTKFLSITGICSGLLLVAATFSNPKKVKAGSPEHCSLSRAFSLSHNPYSPGTRDYDNYILSVEHNYRVCMEEPDPNDNPGPQ